IQLLIGGRDLRKRTTIEPHASDGAVLRNISRTPTSNLRFEVSSGQRALHSIWMGPDRPADCWRVDFIRLHECRLVLDAPCMGRREARARPRTRVCITGRDELLELHFLGGGSCSGGWRARGRGGVSYCAL